MTAARPRFQLGELFFTWDSSKYETNVRRHGITFEEAATTWLDTRAIERVDEEHSEAEDRWLRIGMRSRAALLVIWSAERERGSAVTIRLIGARKATPRERKLYERQKKRPQHR